MTDVESVRALSATDLYHCVEECIGLLEQGIVTQTAANAQQLHATVQQIYRASRLQSRSLAILLANEPKSLDRFVYHLSSIIIDRQWDEHLRRLASVLLQEMAVAQQPRIVSASFAAFEPLLLPLLIPLLSRYG
jgi:hypothetical protein